MKIAVMSDSHGCVHNIKKVLHIAKNFEVKKYIHLGDDETDCKVMKGLDFVSVPGIFSSAYSDPKVPNRLIFEANGFKILLTHTMTSSSNDLPADLKPEELIAKKEINAVFYGHTHLYEAKIKNNLLYFNPGNLKDNDNRSKTPTFGLIEILKDGITGKILTLTGVELCAVEL